MCSLALAVVAVAELIETVPFRRRPRSPALPATATDPDVWTLSTVDSRHESNHLSLGAGSSPASPCQPPVSQTPSPPTSRGERAVDFREE